MRVAWKETADGHYIAHVGPCWISLRPMDWYHPQAREHREAIDRIWIYSVRQFSPSTMAGSDLTEGVFEVEQTSREGGARQAKERAVALARAFEICKRPRRVREAIAPESVGWLDQRLLDTLRESYASWRESVSRVGRGVYPEPRWSTARLAAEAAQYSRPEDLDVDTRRFYALVAAALKRLKRKKLVASSRGLDDRGHETALWEPTA
jgi:hypothetical protein